MFGKKEPRITYLIGDFSGACVSVRKNFYEELIDLVALQNEVHDVHVGQETFRFWNASEKFRSALAKRPNAFIFQGDLSGQAISVGKDGIRVEPSRDLLGEFSYFLDSFSS